MNSKLTVYTVIEADPESRSERPILITASEKHAREVCDLRKELEESKQLLRRSQRTCDYLLSKVNLSDKEKATLTKGIPRTVGFAINEDVLDLPGQPSDMAELVEYLKRRFG